MTAASHEIGPASTDDLPAILEILNREALEGVALWNEATKSAQDVAEWFDARRAGGYPVLAARVDGALVGFGSFGPFRPHEGYRETVELSLYIAPEHQGRGIGKAMLAALERCARERCVHVMIGGIEASNAGSIALHRSCGFEETARMPEVGLKFGRRLTLVLMQKILR